MNGICQNCGRPLTISVSLNRPELRIICDGCKNMMTIKLSTKGN